MKGCQSNTFSSLVKTGVSHTPVWCGLHFTRNVAAAGLKEQRTLDVRARKHESCWFAMLLHPGCYPEKLKFLSPVGLVVRWMAKPQSLQEKQNWAFIQVGVFFFPLSDMLWIHILYCNQTVFFIPVNHNFPALALVDKPARSHRSTVLKMNKQTKKSLLSLKSLWPGSFYLIGKLWYSATVHHACQNKKNATFV